jgi:hypothetical protein
MVPNLSQEEELIVMNMMKLKHSEAQLNLIGGILSTICPLSILAISIVDAFNQSNPMRLLMIIAYPLSIIAMSINRRAKSVVAAYIPIVLLILFLFYGLKATFPIILCVIGVVAAYHMLFNSLPLVRLQLEGITKSPLYASVSTKLLKDKLKEKNSKVG